jgi:hypothetical protein
LARDVAERGDFRFLVHASFVTGTDIRVDGGEPHPS